MRAVRMFVAAAGAAVVLGATAAPAQAAPSSPAGCTFDRATGRTTCVAATTSTEVLGPFNAQSVIEDGSLAGQWCLDTDGDDYPYYSAVDAYFTATTTRTTTTSYPGRSAGSGKKVTTSTTSATSYVYTGGFITCGLLPF